MSAQGNSHSRNPNICTSCSSLVDGEAKANVIKLPDIKPPKPGKEKPSTEKVHIIKRAA
jgi:hypothetical protein